MISHSLLSHLTPGRHSFWFEGDRCFGRRFERSHRLIIGRSRLAESSGESVSVEQDVHHNISDERQSIFELFQKHFLEFHQGDKVTFMHELGELLSFDFFSI